MNNFIQDGDGDQDEKRLAGLIVTGIGLLMAIIYFTVGMCVTRELNQSLLPLIYFLVSAGFALLGWANVSDGIAKKLKGETDV